ncbi:hypothetical protein HPB48_023054 [Haemaphysalis longicornis]|uniref:Transposable element P transposase n=1 Tax=Haemaphysalis longicornis TaxID=44386 RepID=A0A9J6GGK9_HAELO|nr:hypothetical protein HPB48_023054 [Haemaphysalis longicornis]
MLNVTPENPFFEACGEKVYFLFDTPHLIKCTRNNLRYPHKLFIGNEVVDWKYITALYESNDKLISRLAPKLTDDHVYKRPFNSMKVKFATQVFSQTVSTALSVMIAVGALDGAAEPTATFIERMDNLFDCLNSKHPKMTDPRKYNFAISANSKHLEFLREALEWIASWRFDIPRRQPHTIRGWRVTIQSVLMLWEELSQNFDFDCLLTRNLQQDPLENFFGSVRQKHGCNEHPNVLQFIAALKHISVGKLFNLTSRGNCEIQDTYVLARLAQGNPNEAPLLEVAEFPSSSEVSAEGLPDILEQNTLFCFSGHLVQQFLKSRPAECACGPLLRNEKAVFSGSHQILALLRSHDEPGGLFGQFTAPSHGFFEAVMDMEKEFLEHVGVCAHLHGTVAALQTVVRERLPLNLCCSEACHGDIVQHFCRTRIVLHVKEINRVLKKTKDRKSATKRKLQKV